MHTRDISPLPLLILCSLRRNVQDWRRPMMVLAVVNTHDARLCLFLYFWKVFRNGKVTTTFRQKSFLLPKNG